MVNDIWGFKGDDEMAKIVAKYNVPCCIMHNRDNKLRPYNELIEDVISDLKGSINLGLSAGVLKENIILDPGVGFGKTLEDNLKLMNNLEKLGKLGCPVLLGTSRKSMIGLTLDLPVEDRLEGTLATTVLGIMKGCSIVRVHDVKENYRALKMTKAIMEA
jgi:dihydropteroate synthase